MEYQWTPSTCARFAIAKKESLPSSSIHDGTSSVSSSPLTAMSKKRSRQVGREQAEQTECPICFEAITERTEAMPFHCNHLLCITCHKRMIESADHRCPTCRAPRLGFTREEAEPEPDRNHDPPSIELPLVGWEHFVQAAPHMTLAASGYGRARIHRPNTGHTMHFPRVPPSSWHDPDDWEQLPPDPNVPQHAPRMPPDLLGMGLMGMAGQGDHTLAALGSSLSASMIHSLLNLPDVSTIQQWHAQLNREAEVVYDENRQQRRPSSRQRTTARRAPASRSVRAR